MSSKSTPAYIEFFSMFKKMTPDSFVMKKLHVDQESAILRGIDFEFGNCEVLLCQWHLIRTINAHYSTFNYLSVKTMKSKFSSLYKMIQSLIHLPLHDDQIRRAVIMLLEKERQKYKKGTRKMMYQELKNMENYLMSYYLNNTSRSPPSLWASKKVELGHAFHTTAQSESTNSVLRTYIKSSENEQNQVHDLTKVVRLYNKNILGSTLDDHKTRRKSKKRVVKSMILCGLFHRIKQLKLYHHDESKSNEDLITLRKAMLMVTQADSLVKTVLSSDIYFTQILRRHLNDSPEDVEFLKSYTDG